MKKPINLLALVAANRMIGNAEDTPLPFDLDTPVSCMFDVFDGDGVQEDVIDVQMWNKNQAIDSALKHLGMLTEPVEHGGDITIRWQTEEEAKGS